MQFFARQKEAGFSLVEALVAMAITSATLVIGYQAIANGIRSQVANKKLQIAMGIAETRLAEADLTADWNGLSADGSADGGFKWVRRARALPVRSTPQVVIPGIIPVGIEVTVTWGESEEHAYRLYTARLFRGDR